MKLFLLLFLGCLEGTFCAKNFQSFKKKLEFQSMQGCQIKKPVSFVLKGYAQGQTIVTTSCMTTELHGTAWPTISIIMVKLSYMGGKWVSSIHGVFLRN